MSETIDLNQQDVKFQAPPDLAAGSKEGGQEIRGKKAFVAYRDNIYFRENREALTEVLGRLDYQVITQIFPEGTPLTEITEWARGNAELLTADATLADGTFLASLAADNSLQTGFQKRRGPVNLDMVFEEATAAAVLGDAYNPNTRSVSKTHEMIEQRSQAVVTTLIKNILSHPENMPDHVTILTHQILEHPPFDSWKRNEASERQAAELIKKWLVEAGIPEEKIKLDWYLKGPKDDDSNEPEVNKRGCWIIGDRHLIGKYEDKGQEFIYRKDPFNSFKWEPRAKVLQLPVGNLVRCANSEKILVRNPNEPTEQKRLEAILKQSLAKR